MSGAIQVIENPYSLCGYVIAAVLAFLAKTWKSKGSDARYLRLFRLAAILSLVALSGGLFLGWQQLQKGTQVPCTVSQNSGGDQSPNVASCGDGTVTVQVGSEKKK